MPCEVEDAIRFESDTVHDAYDPEAMHRFWLSLVSADRVLGRFRAGFRGKASPVHFFWGAFDLAVTRFSGRPAPRHPGGIPHCPDWVMEEAYSDEVSSAGYWPGGADEGVFYSYAYPAPPGFAEPPGRADGGVLRPAAGRVRPALRRGQEGGRSRHLPDGVPRLDLPGRPRPGRLAARAVDAKPRDRSGKLMMLILIFSRRPGPRPGRRPRTPAARRRRPRPPRRPGARRAASGSSPARRPGRTG